MKQAFLALFLSLVAPMAFADLSHIAPTGWKKSQSGKMTIYQSPTGQEVMIFRYIEPGNNPAAEIARITNGMAQDGNIISSRAYKDDQLYIHDITYSKRSITMQGRVIGVKETTGQFLAMGHLAPESERGLSQRMAKAKTKMASLASSQSASSSRPSAPIMPTSHAEVTASAQKVLFDLKYKYGVGGAVYPTYSLVILLENGTAVKLGNFATNRIDVGAIRTDDPGNVGQWRRAGSEYHVQWEDGDTSKLKTSVGPPRALPNATKLIGTFQAIGGGGNTALGGQTLAVQAKSYSFFANGTFVHSNKTSVSSPAAVGGSNGATAGRWALDGPNLTLVYNNGRTYQTSVFFSDAKKSKGKNNRYDVIWIGGEDFKRRGN